MMRRHRVALVIAVLAGTAILVAALGVGQTIGGSPRTDDAPPPDLRPTKRAAVVVATAFLTSIDLDVLLDEQRRNRVVDHFAAPESRMALRRLYAAERRRVGSSYRERPRFVRAALAGYRVDELTPKSASISIWAATIGGSGSFAPTAGWSTTTVVLAWDADRWRVTSVHDEAGPSPEWPISTLASEGGGFEEYTHAP